MTTALACLQMFDMRELLTHEAYLLAGLPVGIAPPPPAPPEEPKRRAKSHKPGQRSIETNGLPRRPTTEDPWGDAPDFEDLYAKPKRKTRKRSAARAT